MRTALLKSRMARRLVRISLFLVATPLLVTVILLSYVGRKQIAWTTRTMRHIHEEAFDQARENYQSVGRKALLESGRQASDLSVESMKSVSRQAADLRDAALAATTRDFCELASKSIDGAMRQSLETNRQTMENVQREITSLNARAGRSVARRANASIQKIVLAQTDTLMHERADHLAQKVSGALQDALNYMSLTAQMPEMRGSDPRSQKAILDALVRRFPQIAEVTVQDRSGRETAKSATDRVITGADLGTHSDDPAFCAGLAGNTYIADEDLPPTNGAPTLRLAVPVEAYRGKVVGVLSARFALADVWDRIRNTRIGENGFAYVTDRYQRALLPPHSSTGSLLTSSSPIDPLQWNVVVAVPGDEARRPLRLLHSEIRRSNREVRGAARHNIQAAARQASAQMQRDTNLLRQATTEQVRERSRLASRRVRETTERQTQAELQRLHAALRQRTAQIRDESDRALAHAAETATENLANRVKPLTLDAQSRADRRFFGMALILLLISCIVGSALALLTAVRIVRPVVDLAQMTQAIAAGDLEKRVDERAPDEIRDLAAAFNVMAASLAQSRAELQEAEGQLVQSAKLASLGTLSAGVAHELNQPLAIIRGVAQQLAADESLSADMKSDLVLIEGQTGRMIKIIRHLRTFCRSGATDFTEVDPDQVVQDCFLLIGEQLRTHNIALSCNFEAQGAHVMADANALEQVVLNLLTNARDALEGQPDAALALHSRITEEGYLLEVRDNGTGVPEEILGHIFDPFFTTKEPGKGTGLGLSISHSIVSKHGGSLRVHNDGGAVFTIVLPLAEPGETAAIAA